MPHNRTHIQPGQKLELKLTPVERKTILDHLLGLPPEHEATLRKTHPEQPLLLTLDDLDDFAGYVAAASNHTTDKKVGKVLDAAYRKMGALLDRFTDEQPAAKKPAAKKARTAVKSPARAAPARTRTPAPKVVYQFKITLLGTTPTIWRRIQTADCKLNTLHQHIQAAMGWTNSHLHHFLIGRQRYGIPKWLDDPMLNSKVIDSTKIWVSDLVPPGGKRCTFEYAYDMGDYWEHEILFEGQLPPDPKLKYPLCLEGARACPPEDCGGVPGYEHMLDVLVDPEHEEYEAVVEWIGGPFDPSSFDVKRATARMTKGLRA